jgi:hypothetical protein
MSALVLDLDAAAQAISEGRHVVPTRPGTSIARWHGRSLTSTKDLQEFAKRYGGRVTYLLADDNAPTPEPELISPAAAPATNPTQRTVPADPNPAAAEEEELTGRAAVLARFDRLQLAAAPPPQPHREAQLEPVTEGTPAPEGEPRAAPEPAPMQEKPRAATPKPAATATKVAPTGAKAVPPAPVSLQHIAPTLVGIDPAALVTLVAETVTKLLAQQQPAVTKTPEAKPAKTVEPAKRRRYSAKLSVNGSPLYLGECQSPEELHARVEQARKVRDTMEAIFRDELPGAILRTLADLDADLEEMS